MPACVRQYTLTEGHGVQLLRHNWLRTASRRESLLVVLRTTVCHHSEHRCRHMLCKEPEPRTDCSYCSALSQEQPLRCEPSSSRSARANRLQPLPTSSAATTAMQCALWRCAPLERRVGHHTDATLRQPLDWRGHCVGRCLPSKLIRFAIRMGEPLRLVAAAARLAAGAVVEANRAKQGTVQLWDRRACS